jgi:hypothetical protein
VVVELHTPVERLFGPVEFGPDHRDRGVEPRREQAQRGVVAFGGNTKRVGDHAVDPRGVTDLEARLAESELEQRLVFGRGRRARVDGDAQHLESFLTGEHDRRFAGDARQQRGVAQPARHRQRVTGQLAQPFLVATDRRERHRQVDHELGAQR